MKHMKMHLVPVSGGGGYKRTTPSESIFWYCKGMGEIEKEGQIEGGWDPDECDRQRKLLKRELKNAERELVPPARAPAGEGTKGSMIKGLNLNNLKYDEENPHGEFKDCTQARAVLKATCGAWLTPASGARGGGNGKVQSYHAKDAELTAACKVKLINQGTDTEKAVIYWLDDAEEAAPTTFEVRILAICRALLHIPLAFVPTFAARIFHAFCSHLTRTHEHRTHIRRRTMMAASRLRSCPRRWWKCLTRSTSRWSSLTSTLMMLTVLRS